MAPKRAIFVFFFPFVLNFLCQGFLFGFLGKKDRLDIWYHTSFCDGNVGKRFVQLLVTTHSKDDVAGSDSDPVVGTSGITRQLQDLSGEIFKCSSQVEGSALPNMLCIFAFAKTTVDMSHRKYNARSE